MAKMPKTTAAQYLADVARDAQFWCHDGRTFQNLGELQAALDSMTEDSFHYHVNEGKNDFSNWVSLVIGDQKLARDLRSSSTPAQAAGRVAERIAFLKERAR
ncbi:MAG: hypothetical protein HYX96_01680 [Chloroflexi bacterium]|nr:hypothetical protein [Chloroflexota bacterium]